MLRKILAAHAIANLGPTGIEGDFNSIRVFGEKGFFGDLDDLVIGPPTGPIGASTGPDAFANFTATKTRSTSTESR